MWLLIALNYLSLPQATLYQVITTKFLEYKVGILATVCWTALNRCPIIRHSFQLELQSNNPSSLMSGSQFTAVNFTFTVTLRSISQLFYSKVLHQVKLWSNVHQYKPAKCNAFLNKLTLSQITNLQVRR